MDADQIIVKRDPNGIVNVRCPTPFVHLQPTRQTSLRLNDPHYVFPETPDLRAMTSADIQLDFLRNHLTGYCDIWRKPQKLFLDQYFKFIAARVSAAEIVLSKSLEKFVGLYNYRDWTLSAPRPLPRALMHTPTSDTTYTPVDFGFWFTGKRIAVLLAGTGTPTRADKARRDTLKIANIYIVDISLQILQRDGPAYLDVALPADFSQFWDGQVMPSSPFKGATLGEIVRL